MKVILAVLASWLLSICASAQPTSTDHLIDSVLARTQRISLYADRVNWDSLGMAVRKGAADAGQIEDLKPAFETLLNSLGDHHGVILDATTYSTIARYTDWDHLDHPDTRPRDPAAWQWINGPENIFLHGYLDDSVGYLRIPGISPQTDSEGEARHIREAVITLAKREVKGWIIDLRYNGGGNVHPMLAGLGPLVGDGIVGHLADGRGRLVFDAEIREGNFIFAGQQAVDLPNEPTFHDPPKVAVLTSRYTVSSGELVATAFKGRPKTRFFGEATGSMTTNNAWEIVGGQVILNISTAWFADREGIVYRINIPVDVEVEDSILEHEGEDPVVAAALAWLRNP